MKIESTACLTCSAQLPIHPGSQFCRCEHCGREYVINWEGAESLTLTGWDTMLNKVMDQTEYLAVGQRLKYIGKDIDEAIEEVAQRAQTQQEAESRARRVEEERKAALEKMAGAATVSSVVCLLLWLATISGGKLFIPAAVMSLVTGALWAHYDASVRTIPELVLQAQMEVEVANNALSAATANLRDFLLEKEFCDRKVTKYRIRMGGHPND